jgi:RNA polymerase-binding protein DksA
MTKLSQESLQELKSKLDAKKVTLDRDLTLLNAEDSYADLSRTDGNSEDADEANEDLAHEESQIKLREVNKSLDQVQKALDRIADGSYGFCEVCSDPIDLARLQAYPEATTCLEHSM